MTGTLGASEFRAALEAALRLVRARRAAIDAANVYPVPDGDTGTNLVMTLEAVATALGKVGGSPDEVAKAVRTGSLMGARGNSGVILAQILRGLTDALDAAPADPGRVAAAFKRATELAYDAVLEPVEGTILTVQRAAADAAQGAHAGVADQLEAAAAAAREALARTPQQLPLLATAGVVDAGGMGLVAVLEAFAATLAGRVIDEAPAADRAPPLCEGGSLTYPLEVQYLLDAPDEAISALKQLLGTIGDSVAVVGGDGAWRVHVHTDGRDRAVALGEAVGAVRDVEVVSFAEQIAERDVRRMGPARPPAIVAPDAAGARGVPLARAAHGASLVAVASGPGVRRLFEELGALVVDGGRTMNPAVGDLLDAIERAPGDDVVVLPNNENVFAAAGAATAETTKRVTVVRTGDMAEGLAVAVAFGDARDAGEVIAEMEDARARVRTGQVVIAVRDAQTSHGPVAAGAPLCFAEGAFVEVPEGADAVGALVALARALLEPGGEVLTVLVGADVAADERARAEDALRAALPAITVDVLDGGQPVHRYLASVE